MARKIYDEDLRLNLILNGEGLASGSKKMVAELGKMEQEMVKMEQESRRLAASIKNLEKNATANAKQIKLETRDYNALNRAMKAHQLGIDAMRKQVGLAGMTVEQLRNHLNALKVQLYNMPGSAGAPVFTKLQKEIKETEIRLRTLTTGASRMSQAWERLEKAANRAGTILGWVAVGIFAITRITSAVISRMKELEDLLGSVRKNTNLVTGEVWEMKEAFDAMDTRTPTDALLKMAIVAGKLGVAGKDNIMDFVDSANKIQIALGDDLNGSAEDTVNSIGKLTNAFRVMDEVDKKTGEKFTLGSAMLRTGDVLNQLAKSSAASAGTILEYMTRLSGVSELANFSIAQVGALGSVLDALHVPSERGATALQKIMLQLANPKKVLDFAEALGTTAEGYKEMLANDPNMVLTSLLRKFISTKNGLIELTGGLKDFGVKGQYMTAVLGSLAQNLDVVAVQEKIAAKAWEEGTSVMDEYNIMNNNFTAEILKQQKIIRAQTDMMDKQAEPAVLALVTAWAKVVVALKDSIDWISSHTKMLKGLAFAYIALKAPTIWRISNLVVEAVYLNAATIAEQVKIFWMKMSAIWTTNLNAKQLTLLSTSKFLTIANIAWTQGLRAAMVAMRALSTSMYLFPGIALVATIAAIAGAFYLLIGRQEKLTESQKRHQELQKNIRADYFREKADLTVMLDQLKDVNISQEQRVALIKKINTEYGEYLPALLKENATADELAKSYDLVVEALARKITYQKTTEAGAENRIDYDANEAEIKSQEDLLSAYKNTQEARQAIENPYGSGAVQNKLMQMENGIKKLKEKRKTLTAEYTKLQSDISKVGPKDALEVNADGSKKYNESDDTFKARQKQRDDEYKMEEVKIKEQYAGKSALQDQMNEKLRLANVAYLRASAKDYEDSLRTEGASFEEYWGVREKLADAMIGSEKGKKKELKEELADLETKYGIEQAKIKTSFLQREIETEDEYNDQLLMLELNFLADKMNLYKKDSKEYIEAYNELLSKKVAVEKSIEDKISTVQKQFAKIKVDRLGNEIEKAIAIENARWEEEKAQLEGELIDKKELSAKEIEFNDIISQILVAKKLEHVEKIRKINSIADQSEIDRLTESLHRISRIGDMITWWSLADLKEFYGRKSKIIKEQYDKEVKLAGDNQVELANAEKKFKEANFDLNKEMFDAEKKMNEAKMQMAQSYIEALRGIVGAQSEMGKALFLLSRGLAIADIWIKTAATNAVIYSTALALYAASGPGAPVLATAWAAAPIAANNTSAALNTGLILAQTIGEVTQWATGKYPVRGRDDGRTYNAVEGGYPRTGVYNQPTMLSMSGGRGLVGERAPELVVDGDTFRRMQLNAPGLLRDIYAYAGRGDQAPVRQMASGSYPSSGGKGSRSGGESEAERLSVSIEELNRNLRRGIKVNKYGNGSLSEAIDDITKFNSKIFRSK